MVMQGRPNPSEYHFQEKDPRATPPSGWAIHKSSVSLLPFLCRRGGHQLGGPCIDRLSVVHDPASEVHGPHGGRDEEDQDQDSEAGAGGP